MPLRSSLALLLFLAVAPAAWANATVPVHLAPTVPAQRALEVKLKRLVDRWATDGLELSFTVRQGQQLEQPGNLRVYLEGFKGTVAPAWYASFRTLHDELVKSPYGMDAYRHVEAYCQGGWAYMQADCLNASGQSVFRGNVHNLQGMSSAPETQHWLLRYARQPLPASPPPLTYLAHGTAGDPIFVDVPASLAPAIARIRLVDRPAPRWPVALTP